MFVKPRFQRLTLVIRLAEAAERNPDPAQDEHGQERGRGEEFALPERMTPAELEHRCEQRVVDGDERDLCAEAREREADVAPGPDPLRDRRQRGPRQRSSPR